MDNRQKVYDALRAAEKLLIGMDDHTKQEVQQMIAEAETTIWKI